MIPSTTQEPKAVWQPSLTEQYAGVDPQYSYCEQQSPKVEPLQDAEWEAPQFPFVLVVIAESPLFLISVSGF
jgi:hypothetical protein